MNKTVHKKFTGKHTEPNRQTQPEGRIIVQPDMSLLEEAAKDLLQPRPQAIANILKMVREL